MALGDREVVTLFETLSNVLPRSLFTDLGEPPRASEVPYRVAELIRAREEESERLIDWVQLVMVAIFAALYVIAPRSSIWGEHAGLRGSSKREPVTAVTPWSNKKKL
jgi:hypothetical protein